MFASLFDATPQRDATQLASLDPFAWAGDRESELPAGVRCARADASQPSRGRVAALCHAERKYAREPATHPRVGACACAARVNARPAPRVRLSCVLPPFYHSGIMPRSEQAWRQGVCFPSASSPRGTLLVRRCARCHSANNLALTFNNLNQETLATTLSTHVRLFAQKKFACGAFCLPLAGGWRVRAF